MIRISDIYKKNDKPDDKPDLGKKKGKKEPESPPEFTEEEIYNEALLLAKEKNDNVDIGGSIRVSKEDMDIITSLTERVQKKPREMLKYFYENTPVNYLYAHSVNVCILSNILIRNMIYNKDQIEILSLAAFFHDLGMINYIDIVNHPGKLNSKAMKKVKKHPQDLKDILTEIEFLSLYTTDQIIKIASRHHERNDGSGYTEGLKGNSIDRMSSIIAISDVYEALTHDRSWRKAYNRARAMVIILEGRAKNFPGHLVRTLIDELTLFPVGSVIKLSDGRKARVIKTNSQSPTCPTVKILSSNGKVVNLGRQKLISVEGSCERE